jgi:hypothetical protein
MEAADEVMDLETEDPDLYTVRHLLRRCTL